MAWTLGSSVIRRPVTGGLQEVLGLWSWMESKPTTYLGGVRLAGWLGLKAGGALAALAVITAVILSPHSLPHMLLQATGYAAGGLSAGLVIGIFRPLTKCYVGAALLGALAGESFGFPFFALAYRANTTLDAAKLGLAFAAMGVVIGPWLNWRYRARSRIRS